MPSFLPPPSSQPEPRRRPVDVRTLSLAQLHHFAKRGSRSARAELERRMSAAGDAPARPPATPARKSVPARPAVDMDIGSKAAPARRFTAAPFPSTEMLGDLLPLADSPTHPHTQAYSIDVQPEDVPHAAPQEAAPDGAPQAPAAAPVFQKTEVLVENASAQPAASAPAAAAPSAPEPRQSMFRESRAPATQPPALFRESQPSQQPSQFRESSAPATQPPHVHEAHTPRAQASQFRESRAPDSRPPAPARRKHARAEGVSSRPAPLHVPESGTNAHGDKEAERLAAIARQDSAQSRADDVPRFIGLVIMLWGVLVTLTGMVLLASGHGLYVLACGAAACGVGWLLFKLRRLALPLHAALLAAALIWAWSGKSSSLLEVLIQSVPLLIPALWMLVPSIREPLR